MSAGLWAVLGVIAAVAALGAYTAFTSKPAPRPGAAAVNRPQPPGPVPPGKVWSPEHGHWHDAAPAGGATTTTVPAPRAPQPQPPGPTPPGKVWSPEHGHWHDAPK